MASTGTETWQTFSGCTNLELERIRYLWKLRNFSFCAKGIGRELTSPIFGPIKGPQWELSFFPNGDTEASKDHVSLYLWLDAKVAKIKEQSTLKFKFTLLNSQLVSIHHTKEPTVSMGLDLFQTGQGYSKLIKRDKLIELLKGDELNISCEITIFYGDETRTSGQSDLVSISPKPEFTLSNNLESVFKDQKFGDIIIEVADKEFLVYKGILQARSPVFAAMFEHELEEKKQNRIMITDVEPFVIEEMLTYIYAGRSPNIETMANDLLPIAEKYNLDELKTMSENAISQNLAVDNAIATLILADLYMANQLKKNVIDFIVANNSHFLGDAGWEKLQSSLSGKPNLMMELVKTLFLSKK